MAGMREIRRRIRTVRNVQQITKALKLVAAARLQRAQSRAAAARPYAGQMRALISDLSAAGISVSHPLLEVRAPINVGILMITSDRGMAGGYNMNVVRRAESVVASHGKEHVKVVTVGKRGHVTVDKHDYDIVSSFYMPSSEIGFALARQIGSEVIDLFESHQVDRLHLVYTRFVSAIRQQVTDVQLLPVEPPAGEKQAETDYIFEPAPGVLLGSLIPRYVSNQIYQALLESLASEHGARMTAMTSATDNAQEMMETLTLQFNRARQAAITKELTEIVSSAEAVA